MSSILADPEKVIIYLSEVKKPTVAADPDYIFLGESEEERSRVKWPMM